MTLCLSSMSYAQGDYKIIVKVNNEIISNHDIEKEKNYLSALNPQILNISENEIKKISKQSLIREIIKQREVSKYFNADYRPSNLDQMVRDLYTRLNINSEEEFKNYLIKYDLSLKDVVRKLAIEANWNLLIYEKYKNQININEDKIKKKFELENSTVKTEKLFLLSEIVLNAIVCHPAPSICMAFPFVVVHQPYPSNSNTLCVIAICPPRITYIPEALFLKELPSIVSKLEPLTKIAGDAPDMTLLVMMFALEFSTLIPVASLAFIVFDVIVFVGEFFNSIPPPISENVFPSIQLFSEDVKDIPIPTLLIMKFFTVTPVRPSNFTPSLKVESPIPTAFE